MKTNIHDGATPRNDEPKNDNYTADRFVWFDQVVADPKLPASAFKVAYVIATSLWREKGTVTLVTPETTPSDPVREAWIGTRDIADKIGMSRFTVMNAVDDLEERGHLEVKRGKPGRGHANHYRLVRKGAHSSLLLKARPKTKGAPVHLLDGEKVHGLTSRGAPAHQIPLYPLKDVPSERDGAPQARPATDSSKSRGEIILEGEIVVESPSPTGLSAKPIKGAGAGHQTDDDEDDEIIEGEIILPDRRALGAPPDKTRERDWRDLHAEMTAKPIVLGRHVEAAVAYARQLQERGTGR